MKNTTDDMKAYTKAYYIKNRDHWKNFYNKRTKVMCPVCDHPYVWIDIHLKGKKHEINAKLKSQSELIESVLSTDLDVE